MSIEIVVNGDCRTTDVGTGAGARLIDVLRALGLTGTKDACGVGDCGACTVVVEGRPVLACLTLAARVRAPVWTVEGLAALMPDLTGAFADAGGVQCGYCVPGQIAMGSVLLDAEGVGEAPGLRAFDGNVCRCRGASALAAVLMAGREASRGGR